MLNDNLKNKLNIAKNIAYDEPLSKYTTMRVGGNCDAVIDISGVDELSELIDICKSEGIDYYILGRGSNVIAPDEGYNGIIMRIGSAMASIELDGDIIRAGAGASLAALAAFACDNGIAGFEALSGIPGLIGGAIRMNAGAYGTEVKDVLKSCTYLENGEIKTISAEDADLSYRHSVFSAGGEKIIVAATFDGSVKDDRENIVARMNELAKKRREKQPLELPSAGSTFKRPEGYFAAKLIEDAGLKGYRMGGAEVSTKHSGFVVNVGNATAADIKEVIRHVQKTVYDFSGVMLETEVIFI